MVEQIKRSWYLLPQKRKREKNQLNPLVEFGRTNKIGVLASLRVLQSVTDVNRKIIMTLTSDYEMEETTILYREGVTRADIE